jgi:NTE family protein
VSLFKRATAAKPVSLALQGGGAHGAFQWGVLDRLLEDGGLDIQAITGASAGAMNAVALVSGLLEGGRSATARRAGCSARTSSPTSPTTG